MKFFSTADTKRVFKQICKQFDLVYFGNVSQHTDDHQMVRGFTLSPSHVDRHYCVGTIAHRDLILLERTDTISFPDKPSRSYTWTILQIDLSHSVATHLILNSHRYDDIVYRHLFAKFHDLRLLDAANFAQHDPKFTNSFRCYGSMQHLDRSLAMLPASVTSVLGHHFATFDYELLNDTLIIYCPSKAPTASRIEAMTNAGIWLATEIEKTLPSKTAAPADDGFGYNQGSY